MEIAERGLNSTGFSRTARTLLHRGNRKEGVISYEEHLKANPIANQQYPAWQQQTSLVNPRAL